jgi:hypothetical protein
MRDDDLCGSSSSDEDGGSFPSPTRTGKAATGSVGSRRTEEEDWGSLWSDSSAPVDIGMVEEPEDLKFVDTPFTMARRNAKTATEVGSETRKTGKGKKVHSFPFLPIFSRSLLPFPLSDCCQRLEAHASEEADNEAIAPSNLLTVRPDSARSSFP